MSSEIPFEDLTKKEQLSKPELLDYGITEADGITFSFVTIKVGEEIRTAHEVFFAEGAREFHVMPLRDHQGNLSTAFEIVSEKKQLGEELEARVVFYMLTSEKLMKVLDSKYRGPTKNFPSFRETLDYVLEGKYHGHLIKRVEE